MITEKVGSSKILYFELCK